MMIKDYYYLAPRHDSAKSFYCKALVEIHSTGKTLYSYGTKVAEVITREKVYEGHNVTFKECEPSATVFNVQSQTTLRHVKEFLKQEGFVAKTKKQIVEDYGYEKGLHTVQRTSLSAYIEQSSA